MVYHSILDKISYAESLLNYDFDIEYLKSKKLLRMQKSYHNETSIEININSEDHSEIENKID